MAASAPASLGASLDFLQSVWRLNHALERLSRRMEKRIGISAPQRLVLRCIGKQPGISAGRLAAIVSLDPGTVSSALRRLEAAGLVVRTRANADARRVELTLTAAGRALSRPVTGTAERAVTRLLASAERSDVCAAADVLARLTQLLDAEAIDRVTR